MLTSNGGNGRCLGGFAVPWPKAEKPICWERENLSISVLVKVRMLSIATMPLLPLAAKTPAALEGMGNNLAAHLASHPKLPLADVAYTVLVGRQQFTRIVQWLVGEKPRGATEVMIKLPM